MISFVCALLCACALGRSALASKSTRLSSVSRQSVPTFSESTCTSLPSLICNLQPTVGNQVTGTVFFTPVWVPRSSGSQQFTCYTRITATILGLPGPYHGFHVHTYGDLSADDGTAAGGHFSDPAGDTTIRHGWPDDAERHWGDFGNITVNSDTGVADYDRVDDVIRLGAIVGRAVIIHGENDKGAAFQPSGASGPRVAQCVVGYSNPEAQSSA